MLKHKESYLGYKKTYTKWAYNRYGVWLDKFERLIGKEEVNVTGEDILQFKTWLQTLFSEKSVEYAMTVLRNYFLFLKLNNINCLNPQLVRSPNARADSYQAVSPENYQKILRSIDQFMPTDDRCNLQVHLMIRILNETGVRVSELISIMIENVNLDKCGTLIENKKNMDKRWIFWSTSTNELLKKYLPIREQFKRNTRALFIGLKKSDKAITTRSVERIVKMCCQKAGVTNIVPHSFRHGKAHYILENGGTVADVQKTLGHRSPISSMKYLQFSDLEHERRAKMFLAN